MNAPIDPTLLKAFTTDDELGEFLDAATALLLTLDVHNDRITRSRKRQPTVRASKKGK